jgi:hypothetical protein
MGGGLMRSTDERSTCVRVKRESYCEIECDMGKMSERSYETDDAMMIDSISWAKELAGSDERGGNTA